MSARLVEIFTGARKPEAYLYVDKAKGLEEVPEALLAQFGELRSVMSLMLDSQRKLARADAAEVLARIEQQGFYLQLPPTPAELRSRDAALD